MPSSLKGVDVTLSDVAQSRGNRFLLPVQEDGKKTGVRVMGTSDATYEMVRGILIEEFELDPSSVQPEASLVDDLGIDSIDAVDLLVRLKEMTGKQVPPDRFRSVKSVGDVVTVLDTL